MTGNQRHRLLLIGAGRLARALIRSIPDRIVAVLVRPGTEPLTADEAGSIRVVELLEHLGGIEFDTAWILVQDRLISSVAHDLSTLPIDWRGRLAIHSSGAGTTKALLPLASRGCVTAVVHPNGSFSGKALIPNDLFWGISNEIDDSVKEWIQDILAPVRPRLIPVADSDRLLYHVAAATASNYVALLIAVARQFYQRAGVDPEHAKWIVAAFVDQVNRNSMDIDAARSITGPIARGDVDVVRRQLEEITRRAPEWLELMLALARATATVVGAPEELRMELARLPGENEG